MTMDDDFGDDLFEGSLTDAEPSGSADGPTTGSNAAAGGRGKGAAKQVQRLIGRLGFGSSEVTSTSAEARLSSVVSESVEGPALDLLRSNTRFALPESQSWIMLVLPTAGEFGGLNQRTKAEDKGQIIQMIYAESIDVIVTKDLLIDDALGLVPNAKTLDRMQEFGTLTNARYTFACVCIDDLTGGPKVFSVPAVTSQLGTTGLVYERTREVAKGTAELDELINPWVVKSLLAVYRDPSLGHGEGDEALDKAVRANMELTVEFATQGGWPTSAEYVQNLAAKFPTANIELLPGAKPKPAAIAAPTAPVAPAADDSESDSGRGRHAGADDGTCASSAPTTPLSALDASTADADADTGEMVTPVTAASPAEDDGPDFDFDAPKPNAEPVRAAGTATSATAAVDGASLRTIIEAIESLKTEIRPTVSYTEGGLPIGAQAGPTGPGTVVPGSEFGYEEMMDAAARRYLNDDLGLSVDRKPFDDRMTWPAPVVDVPVTGTTSWLGDQVAVLTAALNSELKVKHEETMLRLYRQYAKMADDAAEAVNAELAYSEKSDSDWGRAYATLLKDKAVMTGKEQKARVTAENQVRQRWDERRETAMNDQIARIKQQFDHRNSARIESEVRDAVDQVSSNSESIHQQDLAEFNRLRGIAARQKMDQSISDALASLDDVAEAAQAQLVEMADEAVFSIQKYIDDNRVSDMNQADTNERKLAADTRLEEARAEASARVAAVGHEADVRIAAMEKDMQRRTAEQNRQLEINERTMNMTVDNERARIAGLENRLRSQEQIAQETLAAQEFAAAQQVQFAQAAATAAQNDKSAYIEGQERRSSYMLVALFLAVVIVGAVAFLAGFAL